MGAKVKITVSVQRELADKLDARARELRTSRSALVEEAIELFESRRLEGALREGYRAMSEENLLAAESFIEYGAEDLDSD